MDSRHGKIRGTLLKKIINRVLTNPSIEMWARWILGIVFVYASIHKIVYPADFAKIIYGYGLFPAMVINAMAIILPYVELFSGVCLLVGIWPRSAAILINGLLLVFILAISINLIRGHHFDCGCFSFKSKHLETSGIQLLIRDILLIGVVLVPFLYKGKRRFIILE